MIINKISFLGSINNTEKSKNRKSFITEPDTDCFIRTTAKNPPENEFIEWAKSTDFLNKGIIETLSDKNLIGKGFTHSAYKIDGCDDCILRVSNSLKIPDKKDLPELKIKDAMDKNLKRNYGQKVALIESDDKALFYGEILKKQSGISNGNPPPTVLYEEDTGMLKEGVEPYESKSRKEHYKNCLQFLSNMPQESYLDLIDRFIELDCAGYKFDFYNPNNFLLDKENEAVNIIDLDKIYEEDYKNDLGNALCALINIDYMGTFLSAYGKEEEQMSTEDKNEAIENTIKIIRNYMQAMQTRNVKFSKEGYEFAQLLRSVPVSFVLGTNDIDEKYKKLENMNLI